MIDYSEGLNQTALWKAKTGYDDYGKPEYSDDEPVSINVRKVNKSKVVKNADGEIVMSNTLYRVIADVMPQDKLDGEIVLSIDESVEEDGTVIGKVVYV